MESKIKHLEFIQDVIARMAKNSFLLKGWAITVTAAIVALTAKEESLLQPILGIMFSIMFWALDAHYLVHEKRYRRLFDAVRQKQEDEIDFSLDTKSFRNRCDWCDSLFAAHQGIFYGALVLVNLIIIYNQ